MLTSQNLLQEPYHRLVTYHLPKEHIFHNITSFKDTVGSLKGQDFVDSPLPIDANLNFQDLMRFVSFRFWCAYNRFPELQSSLEKKYNKIVEAFSKNDDSDVKSAFKEKLDLQKSMLWNLSRGFVEDNSVIVGRAIDDFVYAICVDKDDDERTTTIITQVQAHLLKILSSCALREAIKVFGGVIKTPLTEDDFPKLIESLKGIRIIAIEVTPPSLYGMVLPDGIALNLKNIKQLIKPDDPNIEEISVSIGLWVAIHEIGHLLIRFAPFNDSLYFAKMTPPSEFSLAGTKYTNLEAGFLFSIIFLGTLDKMIWENPTLISKLVNLDASDPTIPILSTKDLENLPTLEFKNMTNSGALMMKTHIFRPARL